MGVWRGLVKDVILASYATARRGTAHWSEALKRDGFLDVVHYEAQNNLLNLALKFPELVVAFDAPNATGSAFHTELRCGSIVITCSQARLKGNMPRPSIFRSRLASDLNMMLFESDSMPTGDSTYVILSHGIDRSDPIRTFPSFIDALVPDEAANRVVCQIDLLNKVGEVSFSDELEETEIQETRLVTPKAKKQVAVEKGEKVKKEKP